MAAGAALITAYGHFVGDRAAILPFNQITRIGSEWGEAGLCPADGQMPSVWFRLSASRSNHCLSEKDI